MNQPSRDMLHYLSTAASNLEVAAIDMLGMAVRLSTAGMEVEALRLINMARAIGAASGTLTHFRIVFLDSPVRLAI